jgi:hypothetical protein
MTGQSAGAKGPSASASAGNVSLNPLDANVSVSARNYLRQYLHMIKIPSKIKSATSIWPNADDSEMEFFNLVIEKMIWFSRGQPISSTAANDVINVAKQTRRQNLLMEQGLVEVLLRMINRLIPITECAARNNPLEKFFIESGIV